MGKIIMVLGSTGSGKSRSVKNLNPKETFIINVVASKDLPFKGSRSIYNKTNGNFAAIEKWDNIVAAIQQISDKAPHIKNIIIDDMRFVMEKESFELASQKGYEKFTTFGKHFQAMIESGEKAREDLTVVLMLHDDDVYDDKIIIKKKVKLIGKLVEDHYNPLEVVTTCLYAVCNFDKDGKKSYNFITHEVLLNGVKIPAKSPEEMFEDDFIPNDLDLVIKAMNDYYN